MTVGLPFTGLGAALGFVPLPLWFVGTVLALTSMYLLANAPTHGQQTA